MLLGKVFVGHHEILFDFLMFGLGFPEIETAWCILHFWHFCYYLDQFFNLTTDKFILSIFGAAMFLGDVFSLLLAKVLIEWAQLDWSVFVLIFAALLFLSGLLVHACIDQQEEEMFPGVLEFL